MPTDSAIVIEGLSKRYRIGASGARDGDVIWALRDVTLELRRGEVSGVIGGNGAGKSTLLKILSRITPPSAGRAEIRGSVGSLLEVGTGFHPELTGRENVYLNGAILGMGRREISARFDEIVAFAEVEKFIDTPVKRYSSGMHMRLAFAVAAHLEPDILLVDEVLAVGDLAFQEKCLAKVDDAAEHGRTVVFVSHNMAAIHNLCSRVAVFEGGRLAFLGDPRAAVTHYVDTQMSAPGDDAGVRLQLAALPDDLDVRLHDVRLAQPDATGAGFRSDRPIEVSFELEVRRQVSGLRIGFDLSAADTASVAFRSYRDDQAPVPVRTEPGRYTVAATIPADLLAAAAYQLAPIVVIHQVRHVVHEQIHVRFDVQAPHGSTDRYGGRRPGIVAPIIPWTTALTN